MKKLINDPRRVVPEMLEGLAAITPGLALLEGMNVVLRADAPVRGEVALISGGGAGHEPAHAGYVGAGMLTAAVSGEVFTSPSTDAVLAAIRAVSGGAGVLLIVKNYTGDRLNFGLAAEVARAEGIQVEMVIVGDDVALEAGGAHAGRRGLAGTVLVHKVAGAAAASGLSLAEVKREAEAAAAALGTMGVALTPCIVPAAGRPGFNLAGDEIELGLGIHGEPGVRRERIISADALVREMLDRIARDLGLALGERVALLVNGLGGTPAMELMLVARSAIAHLAGLGIAVERAWAGSLLTALEMAGCSLSLLRLDERRLARLDAPTLASAWPGPAASGASLDRPRRPVPAAAPPPRAQAAQDVPLVRAVHAVCAALRREERRLTELDQAVGDGDLGISLARGAEAVTRELPGYDFSSHAAALRGIAGTVMNTLGGTSGPLYAALLLRAAASLEGVAVPVPCDWAVALQAGIQAVAELGGAEPGDRTMLDALYPASAALRQALADGASPADALRRAASAAHEGAAGTARVAARRGRSSYLGERAVGHPDPGAEAVVVWLEALRAAEAGAST
ncbi:MAG TPA: dihydroxyacetone kinase subunit DhaK [Acetobacteraceae bacterium]|nr:dihydroxyacetone kinase subunit DhaK [Acetobacteraceae bacterium]